MKQVLSFALIGLLLTVGRAVQVVEESAGFSYVVGDSFVKMPHPGKRLAPDIYFDGYGSKELGFGIGGQVWRVTDWETVVKRATEKMRAEAPSKFLGELIEVQDKSDSGEPITMVYAKTDNERVPVFALYSFKIAPHAWVVYFVIGRSTEPAEYLAFAKTIYRTVKVADNKSSGA